VIGLLNDGPVVSFQRSRVPDRSSSLLAERACSRVRDSLLGDC
jgi:hypothetical protein